MDFNLIILFLALLSTQISIIAIIAIVYNRDKLADKALSIFGKLSSTFHHATDQDRPQTTKKEASHPPP